MLEKDGEGVYCDDGAVIALCSEEGAGFVDGLRDLGGRVGAAVDELVADCDGVEDGPVFVPGGGGGGFGEGV